MRASFVALVLILAACPAPRGSTFPSAPGEPPIAPPREPDAPKLDVIRVATAGDLPDALVPGTYRLHLIDVGTGLAVLIQGTDFTLLYDAGTNDRQEKPTRVTAYLGAVLGPSGDDLCGDGMQAPKRRIDHVVLSHPHLDHASALDLVLHCYQVAQFWDSGRINDTVFYRELLSAIGKAGIPYHTAADVPGDRRVSVKGLSVEIPNWQRFSEGDSVQLGEGARFTILHANPKTSGDPNQSSIVLSVELGRTRVLLVGDAESGDRKDPSYPVGDVEEYLIDHHKDLIRADILQVGHHGSLTSSRHDFLVAVKPSYTLVSSGPKTYGKRTLPDQEVIDELGKVGATVLRTDERDGKCPVQGRIGGNDDGPGGCDTWVITIGP